MDHDDVRRLRLLQRIEQLQAALESGDGLAAHEARTYLARIVSRGSTALLADVFAGIITQWDKAAEEWERLA